MNKTAIKNFAVWARRKLITDITYKAGLIGVSEKGIADPLPQSTRDLQFFDIGTREYAQVAGKDIDQRNALVKAIREKEQGSDYATAFKAIIEEIAYTWFNRLIAIRFMEVNDYLPSRIRVLSSENPAKNEPDFVTTPFDTDMEFTDVETDRILQLKDENKLDELFRMLFIKQCNKLHEILPQLFEKTNDYTELLLTISFTDQEGVVWHLVHDIEEENFDIEKEGQVEIIGWMYQYYISEKHDEIINIFKGAIKKADIPAATQLFTTDWVVRYMVDNSLGRYWIERNPESNLSEKLDFFVKPKNGEINYIKEKIEPKDLTFFDPCMGSGHILVYAFDVLMEIYRECGYSDRDAAQSILENNIFGLDIDERAYQLAYFAVMMKARQFDRRIFTREIVPHVCAIEESNGIHKFVCEGVTTDKKQNEIGEYLIETFRHAKEIGSLQTLENHDYDTLAEYMKNCMVKGQLDLFSDDWMKNIVPKMQKFINQAKILSGKYAVVCTNPPYMNRMDGHLKKFVTEKFKAFSGDMFSLFMYRNFGFCIADGYSAFMTPNVWMFIKSYEELRKYIIHRKGISSLVQIAKGAFYKEATVDVCTFVLKNENDRGKGVYFRLEGFKGYMDEQKDILLSMLNKGTYLESVYETYASDFERLPGCQIAYWISENIYSVFNKGIPLGEIAKPRQGMATTNNNLFLRLWYETDFQKIGFDLKSEKETIGDYKWFPYNKGGEYRKWYGNNDYVVNFQNKGQEVCAYIDKHSAVNHTGRVINRDKYFHRCITWTMISSSKFGVRYSPDGFIFDIRGSSIFLSDDRINYLLGLLASNVTWELLKFLSPTISFEVGTIALLPIICDNEYVNEIDYRVDSNITMSKNDWDSFETSWDFKVHPLISVIPKNRLLFDDISNIALAECYMCWENECNDRFNQLKANEEEVNRIFIDIYGLQDELTPEVEDKDVTVRKADLGRDIRSLLSYAVGCMFGRYSLDVEGLAYAGGEWDYSKYSTFIPDPDNCIPITDEEYFEDDIVGRFCDWMKQVFGEKSLESNLDYISKALGNKGTTSREVIRNYFLNDFIKDHIKIYQKRPIYWMFDSGKQNGFKALVYMHRWNADTVGNLRVEYLHKTQHLYEREMQRMQEIMDNSHDSKEVAKANKRKEKLQKQLKETQEYDAKLAHIALSRIDIDLDDGVKVNYEKVQTGKDGKKMQILAKI